MSLDYMSRLETLRTGLVRPHGNMLRHDPSQYLKVL